MRKVILRGCVALVGVVAICPLAACGGDDSAEPVTESTTTEVVDIVATTSTSSTTTTTQPPPPALAWRAELDGGHDLVEVGASRVFVLGDAGRIRALDLATGEVVWDVSHGRLSSWIAVAVGDDLVVHEERPSGATITRFDGATGAERWRTEVETGRSLALTVDDARDAPFAVLVEPFAQGFRRLDLGMGELTDVVPGNPRAIGTERVVAVTDETTLNFYDLASMSPAGAPIDLGPVFGLDALAMSGPDLLMVNTQELKLLDATGDTLATGRVNAVAAVVRALSGGRVLAVGVGGTAILERDGSRFDSVWRGDGFGFLRRDGDLDYVLVDTGTSLDVVAAAAAEPQVIGSVDLGGTRVVDARARIAGGRLFVTAGGEHVGYDLADIARVWSVAAGANDSLRPFDGGVVRLTTADGATAVELYR